ncbi:hypothetical protein M9458_015538, partial [Cirrhinus mrigala]
MVTAAPWIQSVPSPDSGSSPRDVLYSPECQRRPHRHIMSPRDGSPVKTSSPRRQSAQDHGNQMSPLRLARGELAPQLSLVSPKVFFSICHRWSFGSWPL